MLAGNVSIANLKVLNVNMKTLLWQNNSAFRIAICEFSKTNGSWRWIPNFTNAYVPGIGIVSSKTLFTRPFLPFITRHKAIIP